MTAGHEEMDHIHIAPRRWYYGLMLLASLVFVCGGIFLVMHPGITYQFAGWPGIIFFGLCSAVFVREIIDARPRLVIDDRGIMDRTLGLGMIPWHDIIDARVMRTQNHPFICLDLNNEQQYVKKLKPIVRSLVKANRAMGFNAINLNLSGVDVDPEALCALILAKIEQNHNREN